MCSFLTLVDQNQVFQDIYGGLDIKWSVKGILHLKVQTCIFFFVRIERKKNIFGKMLGISCGALLTSKGKIYGSQW